MKMSFAAAVLAAMLSANAQPARITVAVDQPGAQLNRAMWGIFFEDINFGADGGLYAELVKNRSFEFPEATMGWSKVNRGPASGSWSILTVNPFDGNNPHYVRIESDGEGAYGIANEGFRGMGVRQGEGYDFSVQARGAAGSPALGIELADADGNILASARLENIQTNWTGRKATLHPNATAAKAHLNLLVEGKGSVDVDMVSLFPQKTWKNRPGGLRADMVQLLADLKPGFMRFPGGCIVEGHTLGNRYQWKTTIGPVADRKLILNRWNDEYKNRSAPDYYQSFGLGFYEYFQLCEDIGAQPLPILNCGMACQFNSGELVPLDELEPYVQDALDLIEFANGPVTSPWGAKRAAMGHPRPFHLKMLGVGNEQWGPQYVERYIKFAQALRSQHPEIQLVAAAGPGPGGERFDFLWSKWRELKPDYVDEHFYQPPQWFLDNTHRYDHYDRNGPKVFAGEYAARVANRANNLESALAEAAMMTGFERNGDVVRLASYAPLFVNVDAWQWKPDLIWVDNLRSYGTPDYYVQKMFANNPGDVVLPVTLAVPAAGTFLASATRDTASGEVILKVVNDAAAPVEAALDFTGAKEISSPVKVFTLTSAGPQDENSFAEPTKVSPKESKLTFSTPQFDHIFPPYSLTVLRLEIRK